MFYVEFVIVKEGIIFPCILRISVEKCILCEELKILNLNRDLTIRDKLWRDEEVLHNKVEENQELFRISKVGYSSARISCGGCA